jgi:hypothetical protein
MSHLQEGFVKQKYEDRSIDQRFEHIGMGLSPRLWSKKKLNKLK